jgi:hypothetical protein
LTSTVSYTNRFYLNTGSGWQLSSGFVLRQPIVSNRKPSGMHFAELNGDGLIDIVYGRYNNDKKAYLNNGSNWVESSNLAIPINITDVAGQQIGVKIVDVNNDGLDDIIKALANVTTTYINQGNSWKVCSWRFLYRFDVYNF